MSAAAITGGEPERPPFTPAALAERWGCSTTAVYDLLATGALRSFRVGKLWRIPATAVDEYESGSPPPTDGPQGPSRDKRATDPRGPDDAARAARIARLGG
ncbi:excisionase family DNA-binding protein [Alteriqipengyuania lutimaris]|uniref:excisionase family DNA-binding protein n=1 Tax=Alteriqipengyuania lutimaris TaxID=1538146 RepID=UPI001CFD7722